MQKITEIKITKYRTVREKDSSGNRVSKKVAYQGTRKVNVISGGKRLLHYFIDVIIMDTIYASLSLLISLLTLSERSIDLGIVFSVVTLTWVASFMMPIYYVVFEYWLQRTPGKYVTKSIVIDIYGKKPDLGTSVLRNIIRLVPFETFSCLSERGWHDRWSETFVVSTDEYKEIQSLLQEQAVKSNNYEKSI